jgi:hypothetical protein
VGGYYHFDFVFSGELGFLQDLLFLVLQGGQKRPFVEFPELFFEFPVIVHELAQLRMIGHESVDEVFVSRFHVFRPPSRAMKIFFRSLAGANSTTRPRVRDSARDAADGVPNPPGPDWGFGVMFFFGF